MESILTSIKKLLGIAEEYTQFDQDIIFHINSALMALTQIGVGPSSGFSISDADAIWTDFVPENPMLEPIKSYIYFKVRLMFDPPSSSVVMDALNRSLSEIEWRLNVQADVPTE